MTSSAEQFLDRLTCEFIYNVETARAIGGACVVTEIEIVIIRQSPSDFP
jgi:hypothetical protein